MWQRNGSRLFCKVREVRANRRLVATLLTPLLLLSPVSLHSMSNGFYLEVPYVRQVKNFCGPAALAAVFRYWEHPADQHSLAGEFSPFPSKGLSGSQLKELAGRHSFVAYSFSGNQQSILDHLRKGRPLIVALTSSRLLNLNHYVVLVGWDEKESEWVLHDPAEGAYRRIKAEDLMDKWSDLDNWTLLVLPENGK
jgi:ABC-type bacteriocin/lantibiotic exporter with double-glycine peptidase domain